MPDDPDAMWRPGYSGEVRYPVRASDGGPDTVPPGRRGPRTALIVAVAAAVVAVGAVAVVRIGGDRPTEVGAGDGVVPSSTLIPRSPPLPATSSPTTSMPAPDLIRWSESSRPSSIPLDPVTQWSTSFAIRDGAGGVRLRAVAGSAGTLVAVIDRPGAVIAMEPDDGTQRWIEDAADEAVVGLDIVGGVVLVRYVTSDGSGEVVAHDLETGAVRWSRALSASERIVVPEGGVLLSRVQRSGDRPAGVELLTPHTGEVVRSIEGDDVRIGTGSVQRYDGELVEWFDLTSLNFLGTWLHEPGESTLDNQPLLRIVVEQFADQFTVEFDAGAIGEPWKSPGRLVERSLVPRDELMLVDRGDRLEVLTARTGQLVASGGPLGGWPRPPASRHLTDTGFVLTRDDGHEVAGFDTRGTPLWSFPVSPDALVILTDGGLLVVQSDDDAVRVRYLA